MRENTFALAVDVSDDRIDHDGLRSFIRNNPDVTAWWNQIPSFYLLETRLNADEISQHVDRYANKSRYLVVKIDPKTSQGRLPERAWAWLERRAASLETMSESEQP